MNPRLAEFLGTWGIKDSDTKILKHNVVEVFLVNIDKRVVVKHVPDPEVFQKELKYTRLLASADITPPMIRWSDTYNIIVSEPMIPISEANDVSVILFPPDKFDQAFIDKLDGKIHQMHDLGIGHGDLHIGNIVVNEAFEPFIIDFGTAYQIINHTWETEKWMRQGFGWEDSYASFVNTDYTNWRRYLADAGVAIEGVPPKDSVPLAEEYYIVRFPGDNGNFYIYGSCDVFAKELQKLIGGTIMAIRSTPGAIPAHYVIKWKDGKYVDGTGIYRDAVSMSRLLKTTEEETYDEMLITDVNQETLGNPDLELDTLSTCVASGSVFGYTQQIAQTFPADANGDIASAAVVQRGVKSLDWFHGDAVRFFMSDRTRAWNLISVSMQDYARTQTFASINTIVAEDPRTDKAGSITYLRALRQSLQNNSLFAAHLFTLLAFNINTVLTCLEIDAPLLSLSTSIPSQSAYTSLIHQLWEKDEQTTEAFLATRLLLIESGEQLLMNLVATPQTSVTDVWIFIAEPDKDVDAVIQAIDVLTAPIGSLLPSEVARMIGDFYTVAAMLFDNQGNYQRVTDHLVGIATNHGLTLHTDANGYLFITHNVEGQDIRLAKILLQSTDPIWNASKRRLATIYRQRLSQGWIRSRGEMNGLITDLEAAEPESHDSAADLITRVIYQRYTYI